MSMFDEGIPAKDPDTIQREDSPGKITLSTKQLIEAVKDAIEAYRILKKLPDYHTFQLDASTITRKIIYDDFDAFVGFTDHPNWNNIYARVAYFLAKITEVKENKDWIFSREVRQRLQDIVYGTNCKIDSSTDLIIDFNRFYSTKEITVFECKICKKHLSNEKLMQDHLRNHYLFEFLPGAEKSE